MFIRTATPADLPDIVALAMGSKDASHWPASHYGRVFSQAAPRRVLLIAAEPLSEESAAGPDELLGFVLARIVQGEWEIENIAVLPGTRRRGIATDLLNRIRGSAESENAMRILLEVRQSNAPARGLYEKMGFENCGYRTRYYHDPEEDAVLYHLPLQ